MEKQRTKGYMLTNTSHFM